MKIGFFEEFILALVLSALTFFYYVGSISGVI